MLFSAYLFADGYMSIIPDRQKIRKYLQMPCENVCAELGQMPPTEAVSYCLILASIQLSTLENTKTAQDYCEYGLKTANINNLNKAEILYFMAIISNEKNDLPGCIKTLDKTVSATKKENDPNLLRQSLSFLGNTTYRYGDFNKSLAAYTELLGLCKEHQDKLVEATTYFDIGEVYYRLANTSEANQAATHSIEIFKEINNEKGLADCLKLLGNVYSAENNDEKAEESYRLSSQHYENTNNWHGQGNCSFNLALIYKKRNKYDEAIEALNKACFCYTKSASTEGIGISQMEIGRLYYLQKHYAKAEASFKQAEFLLTESNAKYRLAQTQDFIGDLKVSQNQTEQAVIYYERSIETYKDIKLFDDANSVKEKLNKLKK
jgi:tetratricopeptide (TPR) repeat protein